MWDKMKCYGEHGEHIWNISGTGYIEKNKNAKTPTSFTSPKKTGPMVNLAHFIKWYGILYLLLFFTNFGLG
jgi:hypothetical protein